MKSMNNKAMMNTIEAIPKRGPAAAVNLPPPPRIFLEIAAW